MGLLSPYIKRQRLAMVAPYVRGDVLELGCGPGTALDHWAGRMDSYTGVDYRDDLVRTLRKRHPEHTFHTRNLDDDPLDFPGQFDVVLMIALIEHVYNTKHLMTQAAARLKPGGELVITTPTPIGNDLVHRLGAALGLFARSAADDHVSVFNRARFDIMARDFGLQIARYRRFQVGCNQLVVLRRRAARAASA